MQDKLPQRIKEIQPEQIPTIRKNRNIFALSWVLVYAIGRALSRGLFQNDENMSVVLSLIAIIILICSIIFLIQTVKGLYKPRLVWVYSIVYAVTLFIPMLGFLAYLAILCESSNVFNYYKRTNP